MDGGAWWATDHGVTKSQTRLSDFTFTFFHFIQMRKSRFREAKYLIQFDITSRRVINSIRLTTF